MTTQQRFSKRQGGLVLILVVVGMTSLIAMAGLALDFGLAFLTKTRIQNALDAAALSGAKALKTTGSTANATTDAQTAFNYYLGQLPRPGNTNPVPTIQYSSTLTPFQPGTTPSNFIRVRMPANYTIPTYLIGVLPSVSRTLTLSGSAVAGPVKLNPIGEICNLTPIVVYADTSDTNCSDGSCFGYTVGQTYQLKSGSSAGPGNFNLLDLGCAGGGSGAACVRTNLAGGSACANTTQTVQTQTGVAFGPFQQGIETRFGNYQGGNLSQTDYPPDVLTDTNISYATYKNLVANSANYDYAPPAGVPLRRVISVVMSSFDTSCNGNCTVPVTAIGCFFLTDVSQGVGNGQYIPGEFTLDCKPEGGTLSDSSLTSVDKLFKIVLYKDPDSNDS